MQRIKTLSPQVANLIAAGEVVERPASVVKELVENAIDAGASRVTVEIEGGGARLLRVSDNGCGMSPDDAVACFGRHATSKLRSETDLAAVATLGFRGEALASVAAVAKVTLRTREPGSDEGFEVVMQGGELVSASPCGCPVGTEVVVRDLFFNTPARKKFLKKESTEAAVIGGLLEKLALSRPGLALSYKKDGRESLRTPGTGDLLKTAGAVLGQSVAGAMLPVSFSAGGIAVHGLCAVPEAARPGRQQQIFFVGGRYVRSRVLQFALEEAYQGFLPAGRWPVCVLFVELHPSRVDANVHPQKIEVKFADERAVYDCILTAVREALRSRAQPPAMQLQKRQGTGGGTQAQSQAPSAGAPSPAGGACPQGASSAPRPASRTFSQGLSLHVPLRRHGSVDVEASDWQYYGDKATALRLTGKAPSSLPASGGLPQQPAGPEEGGAGPVAPLPQAPDGKPPSPSPASGPSRQTLPGQPTGGAAGERPGAQAAPACASCPAPGERPAPDACAQAPDAPLQQELALQPFRLVGELFRTYFVAEFEKELWIVDKHAARERILYERLKAQNRVEQQMLLSPIVMEPGRTLAAVAQEFSQTLSEAGFLLEPFGDNALLLRAAPMGVPLEACGDLLLELLELLGQGRRDAAVHIFDELLHRVACAAAVKGGDREPPQAGEALVRELLRLPDVRYCPHGRPCVKIISRSHLEKEFLRG